MLHAFINPEHQKQENNQNKQTQQRKSDPNAELEYINSPEPDTSWNIADVDPVIARHVAQRFAKDEEKDKEVQRKSKEEKLHAKQENIQQDTLQRKGGPGSETNLPEDVLSKMGNSFGTDFSGVNIHKDSSQATQMGALAYTQGNNVHFAPGEFKPETQKGQELLGYELAHVMQQRQGRVQPTNRIGTTVINDNDALEKEADDIGKKAMQGKKVNTKENENIPGIQLKSSENSTENDWESENNNVYIYFIAMIL